VVFGFDGCIKVFNLDPDKESEHHIKKNSPYIRRHHTDIVSCIKCYENRIITAGYDRKLVVYDQSLYQRQVFEQNHFHYTKDSQNVNKIAEF
jgi:hypothetical protein